MSKQTRDKIKGFLLVLLLLAVLLCIPPVSDGVAQGLGAALGWAKDKIEIVGKTILKVAQKSVAFIVGALLIIAGVASGIAVVSLGLVLIGLSLIVWAVWGIFKPSKDDKPEPPDTPKYMPPRAPVKPDNVKINIYD